jgi:RNA polymerase sigma-70 factor (ECF subfamily)
MEEPASASDAEGSLLESERRRLVLEAIAKLPARERAALVLRDLEGMTSERVAKILGSTAGTVRSQVAAARRKVKLALEVRMGISR